MQRRNFNWMALLSAAALSSGLARGQTQTPENAGQWQALERESQGRLGVAVFDTQSGQWLGHRLDERFAMCSTFKWLAAAQVLSRVDQALERLDRRIEFGREALLSWSPVTEKHAGGAGMTVGELCHAAITVSDNAAANLLLRSLGGPEGLTRFARQLGDPVTRLDRWEPELNEATPGDPRDTSSPRAMVALLRQTVLGPALSADSRQQLVQWLQATQTNRKRLAADLPAAWRVGSKTGTGAHGSTHDVGLYWPPGRAPIVVAVFLTESKVSLEAREAVIAQVAHRVHGGRVG
jgi:beta-lactamase class A